MKIAILVSGSGSNLQSIINAIANGELPNVTIEKVIADRNCYAIERALNEDIPTYLIERGTDFNKELDENLSESPIDLIVLAGFLTILSSEFCTKWEQKIINIHPSLLPKYGGKGMYGSKVHQAVLEASEKESGATVHYVTTGVDEGEIICQEKFKIDETDTVKILQQKIKPIEQQILIKAINKINTIR